VETAHDPFGGISRRARRRGGGDDEPAHVGGALTHADREKGKRKKKNYSHSAPKGEKKGGHFEELFRGESSASPSQRFPWILGGNTA